MIQEKLDKFNKRGSLVIEDFILSQEKILELRKAVLRELPSWESGNIDPRSINPREDFRFSEQYKIGNIKFKGLARSQRYTRGKGALDIDANTNWLYGKRSTLLSQFWSQDLVSLIEDENILNLAKYFLQTDELCFHNGSISAVYPGCTGEEMSLHADTVGFSLNNHQAYLNHSNGKSLLNIMIYLDDVDMNLAPTRIFPETHSKYHEVNSHFAECFKGDQDKNYYFNSGTLYDELLPSFLKEPEYFTGKMGSINLMNSSVLHSSTENTTLDLTRHAIILNYSKREDLEFKKTYNLTKEQANSFKKKINNFELISRSFSQAERNYSLKEMAKYFKAKISMAIPRYPTGEMVLPSNFLKGLVTRQQKPTQLKEYLNIGSGPKWRHSNIVALDYDSPAFPGKSEISHDLNLKQPLPFEKESLKGAYTSHNLEHLQEGQVPFILKDLHRCLVKGGVVRITVPDIPAHLDAYERKDIHWFDWIRNKGFYKYDSWLRLVVRSFAGSVVDDFTNDELHDLYKKLSREEFMNYFTDKVDVISDQKLLAPDIHKSWWSHDKMIDALLEAGFSSAKPVSQYESKLPLFVNKIYRRDNKYFNMTRPDKSIFVEAYK